MFLLAASTLIITWNLGWPEGEYIFRIVLTFDSTKDFKSSKGGRDFRA